MNDYILIIGNFGNENKLNGQTARTRTIYNSLQKNEIIKVKKIDTCRKNPFMFIKLLLGVKKAKKIIAMPAQRSLGFISKIISLFRCEQKTIYVVIGGWLPEYLYENQTVKKRINNYQAFLVQTEGIKMKLHQVGINKVVVFPNYRISDEKYKQNINYVNNAIVFYSRIRKDKGAIIAIDCVNRYNSDNRNEKITLDFYGPIDDDFEEEFRKALEKNKNIAYRGILKQPKTIDALKNYRFLFFPTYYEGEGFPGAVLESYMASLPVLASDWKYNKEIIHNGRTGMIFKLDDLNDLDSKFTKMLNDDELIKKMHIMCHRESLKYSEENVYRILHNELIKEV